LCHKRDRDSDRAIIIMEAPLSPIASAKAAMAEGERRDQVSAEHLDV